MIHLPFADRIEAGRLLADEFARRKIGQNAVVLALTRGGVPVGFAIADRLRLPLDIIVARKIGVPWQPELAIGAVAGSVRVLDERMIAQLGIEEGELEAVIAREQAEKTRREHLYRRGRAPTPLEGEVVLVVDDGLATGNTMLAAVRYVRERKPAKIIVGVPVGSGQACSLINEEADDLVCLAIPDYFRAVGEWYRDFGQVDDDEVGKLLREHHERMIAYHTGRPAA
jgi:putative phosphoribosyl transferase